MKHFLLALLLVVSTPVAWGAHEIMPPVLAKAPPPGARPAAEKPTTWDLVVFQHLIFHCLDTTRAEPWQSLQTMTAAFFAFERRRPDVLEEHNGKAALYEFARNGRKTKRADAVVANASFLFASTFFADEVYEEKIVYRTDRVLVLASGPEHINIYFNRENPPDSLTAAQCLRFMGKAGQLFGQPASPCK
jgi:hypothetical protein